MYLRILWWVESSKDKKSIINAFYITFIFDQFNAPLLKKKYLPQMFVMCVMFV